MRKAEIPTKHLFLGLYIASEVGVRDVCIDQDMQVSKIEAFELGSVWRIEQQAGWAAKAGRGLGSSTTAAGVDLDFSGAAEHKENWEQSSCQIELAQQRAKNPVAGHVHTQCDGGKRTRAGAMGEEVDPRSKLKLKLEHIDPSPMAVSGTPSARGNTGGAAPDDKVALPERSQCRQKASRKNTDGGVNCKPKDRLKEPQILESPEANSISFGKIEPGSVWHQSCSVRASQKRLEAARRKGAYRGHRAAESGWSCEYNEDKQSDPFGTRLWCAINCDSKSTRAHTGAARNSERMAGAAGSPKRKAW
ncbi:hypothetical protein C8R45DRAFT_940583 [Mycena sanguinolenta]|nr:hypothetical protein C8R45DRAFT_940583 [Mycena sanguinolenta]